MLKDIEILKEFGKISKNQIQPLSAIAKSTKNLGSLASSVGKIHKEMSFLTSAVVDDSFGLTAIAKIHKETGLLASSMIHDSFGLTAIAKIHKETGLLASSMIHDSFGLTAIAKIQEMIKDLNSSSLYDSLKQNEKFKTFDPEKEALEEVVEIISTPSNNHFEPMIGNFILKNKYKIGVLSIVLRFLCWYFQEEVESLRVDSKKELIPYVISKIQESNPELIIQTNSQTLETTSYQIDSLLEHQLKLNIFSEDQN